MTKNDAVFEPGDLDQLPHYVVHHAVLNKRIEQKLGFQFDFRMATGTPPGAAVEYNVDGYVAEHTEAARQAADRIRSGRRSHNVSLLLNTLALDRRIPFGTYIVTTHDEPVRIAYYRRLLRVLRTPLAPICRRYRERYPKEAALQELDNAILGRTASGSV